MTNELPRWQQWLYRGMTTETQRDAMALDARLFGRAGLGLWGGAAAGLAGSFFGLRAAGAGTAWAAALALLFVGGSAMAMRRAWLQPERFHPRTLLRLGALMMLATYAGVLASMLRSLREGPWRVERLLDVFWQATPLQLLAGLTLLLMLAAVAQRRRGQIEHEAVARRAAEAQLKLLRAQIQPHFIFNTLAALQHWVDTGDARAPALLRTLTGFLRRSTELLTRDETTLADEVALAGLYAEIMRARLGERLDCRFDIAPAALQQPLPPGLLLTLLENAVEHGIAPALHRGVITVRASRSANTFTLDVHDSGAGLAADWHDGVGLANSRERLLHRFGATASLTLTSEGGVTLARLTLRTAA